MSAGGGRKAIFAALTANAGIAVAKFVGFAITGSSSMLAESVHSVADTSNQGLLLVGQNRAEQQADKLHQFGYGRNRYFYAFVVALVLFTLGSLFAIYEGVHKIQHPEDLSSPIVAVIILMAAIALEAYSFTIAVRESRPLKGNASWWHFIRTSRTPELPVVLLEDAGALVGLVLALGGVGLTMLTGDPVWDGIGTLLIGALLGIIAIVLIIEMKSLLIGEGATQDEEDRILAALVDGNRIERVIHCRTQYLGPEEILVAAKVAISPGSGIADVAAAIDQAEARVRDSVPAAKLIYIEPDLYRATVG
ncbi:cation diffusion facilitator family transporter [Rhodococcus xishaensis]|uniref:Cation diffusion facilitator family transporter n=1 Tax=Rhodococcus xishaensis TaxID=2487364 RepID=A0A3S3ZPE3_9NOCA|nr:cation diffusion facilitator family transporter [Rhodococcus xishaensis]RVW05252.1 cation diffusion facilitator family transporter [Rhodococcus xishaensis]